MTLPVPISGSGKSGARRSPSMADRPARVGADTGDKGPAETGPQGDQPWLKFEIADVVPVAHAAAPTLSFGLDVQDQTGREVFMVALTIMIQIEPIKRTYQPEEKERLAELFGEPHRWATSAQRMMWSTETVLVQAFKGQTSVDMQVLCNYDLELAATRYFHGVTDGEIPLAFHFNGTVYYAGENGSLSMTQIPWDTIADFKMPLSVWKKMIDSYYPYRGWLPLQRETLEAVRKHKVDGGLPTYDHAVMDLLDAAQRRDSPDAEGAPQESIAHTATNGGFGSPSPGQGFGTAKTNGGTS